MTRNRTLHITLLDGTPLTMYSNQWHHVPRGEEVRRAMNIVNSVFFLLLGLGVGALVRHVEKRLEGSDLRRFRWFVRIVEGLLIVVIVARWVVQAWG